MSSPVESRVLPIEEILAILKGIKASQFEPGYVANVLEGVSAQPASIERYLHFVEGRYTRNLIFRNEQFELLALCWDEGSFSPIHNHSGQDCWFLVQQGQFCVDGYRILEGGLCPGIAKLEHVDTQHRISLGALDHRGPKNDVHQVVVSRGSPRAVSIHVYAKPFDDCLVYDLKHERCARQPLKYFSVDGRRLSA